MSDISPRPISASEERRAFLETLWSIIVSFVDLGFGVHPLQMLPDQSQFMSELASSIRKVIHSESSQTTTQFTSSVGHHEIDRAAQRES
jgi:hypothetical protein